MAERHPRTRLFLSTLDLERAVKREVDEAFPVNYLLFERKEFDPDQPRDEGGKWTSGGGGAAVAAPMPPPPPAAAPARNAREIVGDQTKVTVNRSAGVDEAFQRVYGRVPSDQQVAKLALIPDGGKVDVSISGGWIKVDGSQRDINLTTGVYVSTDARFMHNDIMFMDVGRGSQIQGNGIGSLLAEQQVQSARDLGIKEITLQASGEKAGQHNGYYTWPRLGYDSLRFDLKDFVNRPYVDAPESVKAAVPDRGTVQDLMALPGGREVWKEFGSTMAMSFSTDPSSRNSRVLDAYMAERRAEGKLAEERDEATDPKDFPEFSDDEEATWDRLAENGTLARIREQASNATKGADYLSAYKTRRYNALGVKEFDPDQPRDEGGKWTSNGGGAAAGPSDAQREALGSLQGVSKLPTYAQERVLKDATGIANVDLKGLDPDRTLPFVKALAEVQQDYPTQEGWRFVGNSENDPSDWDWSSMGAAEYQRTGSGQMIGLNPQNWGPDSERDLGRYSIDELVSSGVRDGYWADVAASDPMGYFATHEYGHAVAADVEINHPEVYERWLDASVEQDPVSEYSEVSESERFAEGFAAHYFGSAKASATADALREAYGKAPQRSGQKTQTKEFDPSQPRDESGKWTSDGGGGGAGAAGGPLPPPPPSTVAASAALVGDQKDVKVTRVPGVDDKLKRDYGRVLTDQEIAKLGMVPNGGTVSATKNWRGEVELKGRQEDVRLTTDVTLKGETVYVEGVFMPKGAGGPTGHGIGAALVESQVETAREIGVKNIDLDAVGSGKNLRENPDKAANGFYTWPRLGFDSKAEVDLTKAARQGGVDLDDLPPGGRGTVQDLFAVEGGRQAWKDYGESAAMRFDTDPTSTSSRVLDEYMTGLSEKKVAAETKAEELSESPMALPTEAEEAVWDALVADGTLRRIREQARADQKRRERVAWMRKTDAILGFPQTKEWDESQVTRDEAGRFSSGGGGGGPGPLPPPPPARSAEEERIQAYLARQDEARAELDRYSTRGDLGPEREVEIGGGRYVVGASHSAGIEHIYTDEQGNEHVRTAAEHAEAIMDVRYDRLDLEETLELRRFEGYSAMNSIWVMPNGHAYSTVNHDTSAGMINGDLFGRTPNSGFAMNHLMDATGVMRVNAMRNELSVSSRQPVTPQQISTVRALARMPSQTTGAGSRPGRTQYPEQDREINFDIGTPDPEGEGGRGERLESGSGVALSRYVRALGESNQLAAQLKMVLDWLFGEEEKEFDPDQPRDESGKWTSGGGGAVTGEGPLPPPPPGSQAARHDYSPQAIVARREAMVNEGRDRRVDLVARQLVAKATFDREAQKYEQAMAVAADEGQSLEEASQHARAYVEANDRFTAEMDQITQDRQVLADEMREKYINAPEPASFSTPTYGPPPDYEQFNGNTALYHPNVTTGVSAIQAMIGKGAVSDAFNPVIMTDSASMRSSHESGIPRDYGGRINLVEDATTKTVVHELGHAVENGIIGGYEAVQNHIASRTRGEPEQSLAQLTGLNYGDWEVTKPDKFADPYMGKIYADEATEFLSMSLAAMYDDPVGFARADPQSYDFTLSLLAEARANGGSVNPEAKTQVKEFDPGQPRDEGGKWTSGGAGASVSAPMPPPPPATARPTLGSLKVAPTRAYREAAQASVERDLNRLAEKNGMTPQALKQQVEQNMQSVLDGAQVKMTLDLQAVEKIFAPDGHFMNQHESGTTSMAALYNPGFRQEVETEAYGAGPAPDDHPKYAYLDSPAAPSQAGRIYGVVEVTFKDEVKDRATMTFGDSLSMVDAKSVLPQPANAPPDYRAVGSYIPSVAFPYAPPQVPQSPEEEEAWDRYGPPPEPTPTQMIIDSIGYVEAQIHGPNLTADDVQSVRFAPWLSREQVEPIAELVRSRGAEVDYEPWKQALTSVEHKEFDPDQPRDDSGRWTTSGGGGSSAPSPLPPPPPNASPAFTRGGKVAWPTTKEELDARTISTTGGGSWGERVTKDGTPIKDDTPLIVYHATTRESAEFLMKEGVDPANKPSNLARMRAEAGEYAEFAPGRGISSGFYVAGTSHDASGYGPVTIGIRILAGDLSNTPEQESLGSERVPAVPIEGLRVGDALIAHKISPEDMTIVHDSRQTYATQESVAARLAQDHPKTRQIKEFDPSQPRDEGGKWTSGGGDGGGGAGPLPPPPPATGARNRVEIAPEQRQEIDNRVKAILGHSLTDEQLGALGGAPPGSTITVRLDDGPFGVVKDIEITTDHSMLMSEAIAVLRENGTLQYEEIYLMPEARGSGAGVAMMARAVEAAHDAGIGEVGLLAAGNGPNALNPSRLLVQPDNGYYTWPRIGFDAELTPYDKIGGVEVPGARFRDEVPWPTEFQGAQRVSDLMRTPEGAAFWKEWGASMEMTIDTTPGSTGRQVMDEYIKARGITL